MFNLKVIFFPSQAQCSSGNEQAAHDHCLAATSEQLLSMYDAGELEELFDNLNVTEILLVRQCAMFHSFFFFRKAQLYNGCF